MVIIIGSTWFYASWNPAYLIILAGSVLINYGVGQLLGLYKQDKLRRLIITLTIVANLILLFYFKYLAYCLSLLGVTLPVDGSGFFHQWALPLGVSFWTFQQINFLLERYNSKKDQLSLLDYVSVVLFFPHLIAGPIVRTSELGPQIRALATGNRDWRKDLAVGLVFFSIGLFKKCFIADSLSLLPQTLYSTASDRLASDIGPIFGWLSVVAYMLQLYFDFSGYCDMGMGLARMFGFTFPINFNSPLKATNFVDFWRRWHITLTRFFTDTLHTPMTMRLMRRYGGNNSIWVRNGLTVFMPVVFTFFLTGVWHGAGNQFVVFGLLNGLLMAAGVIWLTSGPKFKLPLVLGRLVNLGVVSVVFIFFRAPNLESALAVLRCLGEYHGPMISTTIAAMQKVGAKVFLIEIAALFIALLGPNLYEIMANHHRPLGFKLAATSRQWIGGNFGWGLALSAAAAMVVSLTILFQGLPAVFIYFQF